MRLDELQPEVRRGIAKRGAGQDIAWPVGIEDVSQDGTGNAQRHGKSRRSAVATP